MRTLAAIQILLLLVTTMTPEGRLVVSPEVSAAQCCCSADAQNAGTCCCGNPSTDSSGAGSCCGTGHQPSEERESKNSDDTLPPGGLVSNCECGPAAGGVPGHAPRTVAARRRFSLINSICCWLVIHDDNAIVAVRKPQTPPPKMSTV